MSLSITDLISAATPADFKQKILDVATALKLPTTAWQPGGVTLTVIDLLAELLGTAAGTAGLSPQLAASGLDGLIATIAAGGFLDFASSVTPDPSVANPDGSFPPSGNGWLDILADSVYGVVRPGPVAATGPVVLTNATGGAYGPFAVGTYHLVNASTKQTYSNTTILTIGAAGDTTGQFAADVAGAAGTAVANVLTPVTALLGVTVKTSGGANTNTLTGSNAQSNATLVATCRGKLQSLGPKLGPGGAYSYFSTPPGYTGTTLAGGSITRVKVITNVFTGVVSVYLANAAGCSVAVLPAGDITSVNTFLQKTCVPDAVTAVVQRAAERDIAVTLDVYVPAANVSTATTDVQAAINLYVNAIPIGGTPGVGVLLGVPLDAMIAAVFKSVSYVENIENAKMDGAASDVALGASQCAMCSPAPVVTVHSTG